MMKMVIAVVTVLMMDYLKDPHDRLPPVALRNSMVSSTGRGMVRPVFSLMLGGRGDRWVKGQQGQTYTSRVRTETVAARE